MMNDQMCISVWLLLAFFIGSSHEQKLDALSENCSPFFVKYTVPTVKSNDVSIFPKLLAVST